MTRLATELEAKQGLLRGLQTTVQSAKADAESSRSQAEAASSALASLRDAGSDLDRVSAQLNRERQVRMVHQERALHEVSISCRPGWSTKCACLLVAVCRTAGSLGQAGELICSQLSQLSAPQHLKLVVDLTGVSDRALHV